MCGVSDHNILEFHHIDPTLKENKISRLYQYSWDKLIYELKKCRLMCSNCHHKIHHPVMDGSDIGKHMALSYKQIFCCEKCGEDDINVLEFHHSSDDKLFNISGGYLANKNWESIDDISIRVRSELDKSTVLCSSCHLTVHIDKEMFEEYKLQIYDKVDKIDGFVKRKRVDRELLIELNNQGLSQLEISKILKCKPNTVCTILKEMNVEHRRMKVIDVDEVLCLKRELHIGNGKVAKILGVRKGSIQRAIKKHEKSIKMN